MVFKLSDFADFSSQKYQAAGAGKAIATISEFLPGGYHVAS
jgi:hypothetical protein